ncbi:DUF6090 family protein [Brumimicrobium mesophilum]|uniref:DUF6090 family protein n=1 Tax=Brumimicrobium mesophilum TaxID=392717 RepID=UPI000D13F700|nr:DUF6090 family protein [Brumimicrobium mesophilum]
MIKFFRKNRQKTLTENRFGKYLVYATGEIILVVIGILIALYINNWNQNRADQHLEEGYISSLIEDAKTDLSNFDNAISANEERMSNLDTLALSCYNYDVEARKDPELILWYMKSLRRPDFVAQTDRTLSQLKNSGGMQLITEKTKVEAIIAYEKSFERLYNQQGWYEGALRNLVDAGVPIINYKYIPVLHTKVFDIETFFKTARLLETDERLLTELGNRASIYNRLTYSYINYLMEGKAECKRLIEILEKVEE